MYFIESFCGGSSQLRVYSHSIDRIHNYLNKVSKLHEQMISDSDKMNDEFGEPCKTEWEEYNNSMMDMTPENVHEYEARMNSIKDICNKFNIGDTIKIVTINSSKDTSKGN
jgi:DNA repair ATPase RecN